MDRWTGSGGSDVGTDVALAFARLRSRFNTASVSGAVLVLIAALSVSVLATTDPPPGQPSLADRTEAPAVEDGPAIAGGSVGTDPEVESDVDVAPLDPAGGGDQDDGDQNPDDGSPFTGSSGIDIVLVAPGVGPVTADQATTTAGDAGDPEDVVVAAPVPTPDASTGAPIDGAAAPVGDEPAPPPVDPAPPPVDPAPAPADPAPAPVDPAPAPADPAPAPADPAPAPAAPAPAPAAAERAPQGPASTPGSPSASPGDDRRPARDRSPAQQDDTTDLEALRGALDAAADRASERDRPSPPQTRPRAGASGAPPAEAVRGGQRGQQARATATEGSQGHGGADDDAERDRDRDDEVRGPDGDDRDEPDTDDRGRSGRRTPPGPGQGRGNDADRSEQGQGRGQGRGRGD